MIRVLVDSLKANVTRLRGEAHYDAVKPEISEEFEQSRFGLLDDGQPSHEHGDDRDEHAQISSAT